MSNGKVKIAPGQVVALFAANSGEDSSVVCATICCGCCRQWPCDQSWRTPRMVIAKA